MIKDVKVKHFHSQKISTGWKLKTNLSLTSLIHFFKLGSCIVPDFQGNKMLMFREVSLSRNQARKGVRVAAVKSWWEDGEHNPRWVLPKIGVPQNGWFIMENPIKMDDLGVYTTIFGNILVVVSFFRYDFHREPWGNAPIWRAYVSNGSVQPPARI